MKAKNNLRAAATVLNLCLAIGFFSSCGLAQPNKSASTAKQTNQVNQPNVASSPANRPPQNSNLFNADLIKNGGAETGKSAPWTNADENLKTFRYDGGWGDAWQVMPPNKGDNYFYTSLSSESPTRDFSQEFDVSEIAREIDAGKVGYGLSGWFGVRGSVAGRLKAEFYDADKTLINRPADADATEKITLANRPDDVTMVGKSRAGDVPAGTRRIKVTLEFSLFEGKNYNEGDVALADNLSLILTQKQ